MPVHFFFQTTFELKDRRRIVRWLQIVATSEKYKIKNIDYILTDDAYLLSLNKQFLQHNDYTDILTFNETSGREISAEIYISIDRVNENTIRYGTDFRQELHRVIVHGLLHCCGYGDKTPADKKKMRSKENFYLAKMNPAPRR